MNASQYSYGTEWEYLKSLGWKIVPSQRPIGTAAADGPNKRILMSPRAYAAPSWRVRKYVVPHEIWHGIHYETMKYECNDLMAARKINYVSAREVVADGACLYTAPSRTMRAWVKASVIWHGKVGYRYSMADLSSPQAVAIIRKLIQTVQYWRDFSRQGENLPKS